MQQRFEKMGKKLNKLMVNLIKSKSVTNDEIILNQPLRSIPLEPIIITDENSAKCRIAQWINQANNCKQVELTTKAFKIYHRMILLDIYEELHILAVKTYPKSEKKQRIFERDIICSQQGLHVRTERRQKTSAIRIRSLIDAGITFDLLARVLNVSDFEVSKSHYDLFLSNVKLNEIKNLIQSSALSVIPNSPNHLIEKFSEQLEEYSESSDEKEEDYSDVKNDNNIGSNADST